MSIGNEPSLSAGDIETWLIGRLVQMTGLPAERIDPRASVDRYGMESVAGVTLAAELGERLGRRLAPTVVWDYPSIRALAEALAR
jgi:acyl carrier protein